MRVGSRAGALPACRRRSQTGNAGALGARPSARCKALPPSFLRCRKGSAPCNLAKLKKDALAARAEERLAGTGWLPPILREPVPEPGAGGGLGVVAFSEAA